MNKILFDTNIYGLLVIDPDRKEIHHKIHDSHFFIFGFEIIRHELRDTPKHIVFNNRNLRIDLLSVYDDLVKKTYTFDQTIHTLAEHYFKAYQGFGGGISKSDIFPDFCIVACASQKQLDIVVSEDKHSLLTENALKAYQLVNDIKKIRTPNFLRYAEFKKQILSL